MKTVSKYALIVVLMLMAAGAMVWLAAPPDDRVTQFAVTTTQSATSSVANWFRRGPADGEPAWEAAAASVYNADASHGNTLIKTSGCGACHTVPGVTGATGSVGPSLQGFADRSYVAGVLPNEPGGVVRWLVNPTAHSPQTAMPDLGLTEEDARDIAAYLYTLRGG